MTTNKIPIKALQELAKKYGLTHTVLLGYDGSKQHVVTYGSNKENCLQSADAGNKLKKAIGWPESEIK